MVIDEVSQPILTPVASDAVPSPFAGHNEHQNRESTCGQIGASNWIHLVGICIEIFGFSLSSPVSSGSHAASGKPHLRTGEITNGSGKF
jgi:hypothetical protein